MRKLFALAGLALLFAPCAARAADDDKVSPGRWRRVSSRAHREGPARIYRRPQSEGVEGTVVMSVVINAEGRTENIKVTRGLHPDLEKNAIAAVKKWTFKPGMKDGKPVKVQATIEVNFRL